MLKDTIWLDRDLRPAAGADMLDDLARAPVVLLGEQHDRAAHHLWQRDLATALARRRAVVMGFEMFPARLDPVLADWVAGRYDAADFLAAVEWPAVWGFDPALYMPIFDWCRQAGVAMFGLNVARDLVRQVGAGGWEAVPDAAREGLTPAAPSPAAYRRFIFELTGGARPDRAAQSPGDPAFDRFVRAQEVWDRAFATRLAARLAGADGPLVIGIMGQGHIQFGGGVGWQLADLGVPGSRAIVPVEAGAALPAAGAADAVCVLAGY